MYQWILPPIMIKSQLSLGTSLIDPQIAHRVRGDNTSMANSLRNIVCVSNGAR